MASAHTPLLVSRRGGVVWRRIWRAGHSQIRQRLEIGWACEFGADSSLVQHLAGRTLNRNPQGWSQWAAELIFEAWLWSIQEFLVEFLPELEPITEQKQPRGDLHPSGKGREVYLRWEHKQQYVNVVLGTSPKSKYLTTTAHLRYNRSGRKDYCNCFLTILPPLPVSPAICSQYSTLCDISQIISLLCS